MYMKKLKQPVVCTYDDPVAETKQGKIRGLKIDSTYIFRGVRYAVAERFHMPQVVEPWKGIKEAFQYGHVCEELNTPVPHDQYIVPHFFYSQNEHCQYLNIWTQSLDHRAKRPVMVWLHGGGWFSGSSVELLAYDGENLSAFGDVVVVSVNHRLNVLGYLDLSEYGAAYENSANAGLADLVAALKWVNENIENFGGDPDNVTIFGQSGGGAKVCALLQTPAADGLYHRACMDSGGFSGFANAEAAEQSVRTGKRLAAKVLESLGIFPKHVKAIETVDWYDLAQATMNAIWTLTNDEGLHISWEPKANGSYYMGHPMNVGFRNETLNIPLLAGTVFGEFSGNHDRKIGDTLKNRWSPSTLGKYLDENLGEKKEEIRELFAKAYPDHNPADVLFIDTRLRRGCLEFSRERARIGGRVYNWMFHLESPFNGGTAAWHNAEEPFIFHNAQYIEAQYIPDISERLQDQMCNAWVHFAAGGDPNHDNFPNWPAVEPDCVPTICFGKEIDLRIDHDKELMEKYPQLPKMDFPGSKKMKAIFGERP